MASWVDDEPRLGPPGHGLVAFSVLGETWTLDIPDDGLVVCNWAAKGQFLSLVPGCLVDEDHEVFQALMDDPDAPIGMKVCWRVVLGIADRVYGVPWWTAQRLAVTADQNWYRFSSWSVGVGFDPGTANAERLTSAMLAWVFAGAQEEKEFRKLERDLFMPPKPAHKGAKEVPGFTRQEQAASFSAAFAALGGGD